MAGKEEMSIIQVYAPTSDDAMEQFYEHITNAVEELFCSFKYNATHSNFTLQNQNLFST